MNLLDKFKASLKKGSDKASAMTENLLKMGRKAGNEGLELTREAVAEIGDKTSVIATLARLKIEQMPLKRELDREYLSLGKIALTSIRDKQSVIENGEFREQLKKVEMKFKELENRNREYDELRKQYSGNYVVNKLSESLAEANAIIDQAVISEKSNVVDKSLKEILLPKEALISAVKRGNDIIIPDGNTNFKTGDVVTIIGKKEDVEKVVKRLSAK